MKASSARKLTWSWFLVATLVLPPPLAATDSLAIRHDSDYSNGWPLAWGLALLVTAMLVVGELAYMGVPARMDSRAFVVLAGISSFPTLLGLSVWLVIALPGYNITSLTGGLGLVFLWILALPIAACAALILFLWGRRNVRFPPTRGEQRAVLFASVLWVLAFAAPVVAFLGSFLFR